MNAALPPLTPTGPHSELVAGTMSWGEWGADYSASQQADLIVHCLDRGITSFDHADIYGGYTTENGFGAALAELGPEVRQRMQLVTKCGIQLVTPNRPANRLKHYNSSHNHIIASVDRSLQNLRTDYIDLLLLHRPDALMDTAEVSRAFTTLRESGKVRHFGVSNFTPSQFALLNDRTPLVTNQVECHPLHPGPLFDGTYDQAQQLQWRPMVWSPLGGSDYFGEANARTGRLREEVRRLAGKYGTQEDVILLAWCRQHPTTPIPVLGTTKKERLSRATEALALGLDRQDWYAILEAARGYEVA